MELMLLVAAMVLSLVLIPLGLPGLWILIGSAVVYSFVVPGSIGWFTLIGITVLGFVAEVLEFTLTGTYARKYGGSRRAGWGAIIGGMVGMFIGVPVPIVGPVIGGFVGAFVGAFAAELTARPHGGQATRVAWGALVGRVVSAVLKVGVGVVIAAWVLMAAW
jgi:uncharacterized protein